MDLVDPRGAWAQGTYHVQLAQRLAAQHHQVSYRHHATFSTPKAHREHQPSQQQRSLYIMCARRGIACPVQTLPGSSVTLSQYLLTAAVLTHLWVCDRLREGRRIPHTLGDAPTWQFGVRLKGEWDRPSNFSPGPVYRAETSLGVRGAPVYHMAPRFSFGPAGMHRRGMQQSKAEAGKVCAGGLLPHPLPAPLPHT